MKNVRKRRKKKTNFKTTNQTIITNGHTPDQ